MLDAASGNFGYGTPGGADYPHDSRCSWLIKADADAQVHFSVDWIDVEGDPAWGCVTDKVVIHEGSDSASGELESYCGHSCDCEVTAGPTGSSGILVTFTSSFFGSGSGFGISYTVADSGGCPASLGVCVRTLHTTAHTCAHTHTHYSTRQLRCLSMDGMVGVLQALRRWQSIPQPRGARAAPGWWLGLPQRPDPVPDLQRRGVQQWCVVAMSF